MGIDRQPAGGVELAAGGGRAQRDQRDGVGADLPRSALPVRLPLLHPAVCAHHGGRDHPLLPGESIMRILLHNRPCP